MCVCLSQSIHLWQRQNITWHVFDAKRSKTVEHAYPGMDVSDLDPRQWVDNPQKDRSEQVALEENGSLTRTVHSNMSGEI